MILKNHYSLDAKPFDIDTDKGWALIATTTPSDRPLRNYGLGLIGYCWEENGPGLKVREGRQTLDAHVEELARLPFVDVLYIRCDWRDVQNEAGKLSLNPVFEHTFRAAAKYGLRVALRVQLSSPELQPHKLSLPDYLAGRIPLVNIGSAKKRSGSEFDYFEPDYTSPEFKRAFCELCDLLAEAFDNKKEMEFVDLMMPGFWGEGHVGGMGSPFSRFSSFNQVACEMAEYQMKVWENTPLAVNTQPDISGFGNREVQSLLMKRGEWLRTDSILIEEPIQIQMLVNRSPQSAAIIEDGSKRHYCVNREYLSFDDVGINAIENSAMHALDACANYWCLWTEAENLSLYHQKFPHVFEKLQRRLGYRLRPSWVWQRRLDEGNELVIALTNDGVAGVPGTLLVTLCGPDRVPVSQVVLPPGYPLAGKPVTFSCPLPEELLEKQVFLKIEIITKNNIIRPVSWAVKQNLESDGSLRIQTLSREDSRFRYLI